MNIQALLNKRPSSQIKYDLSPKALEMWNPSIQAAEVDDNAIGIFDVIGEDYWGDGVTSKRISAALRKIGAENPVTVNINSPGGDLFEGLSIYNLLKEHKGEVTVRVMALAASAASVIAMAGDTVQIARSGFFMIHNAWTYAAGNRHDFRAFADYLEPFDEAMTDLYSVRTGLELTDVEGMMDRETYIGGSGAIDKGFADDYLASDQTVENNVGDRRVTARRMDVALAKAGLSRTERRKLLNEFKSSTRDAAGGGMHIAAATDTPSAIDFKMEPLPKLQFSI